MWAQTNHPETKSHTLSWPNQPDVPEIHILETNRTAIFHLLLVVLCFSFDDKARLDVKASWK